MKKYLILIAFLNIIFSVSAQENYPRIASYVGIVHPIATFSSARTDFNFDGHYVVGMPLGINLEKQKHRIFI